MAITRVVYADNTLSSRSFWQPTAEEIAAIVRGEPVCFEIFARTHAPILLGVVGVTMEPTIPLETR